MKHVLIIGGTGMLRGVSEYFIEKGYFVTVMARNEKHLNSIKLNYPNTKEHILTLPQDYQQAEQALNLVKNAANLKPIDLAILWIHTTGDHFSDLLKNFLFYHHHQTIVWQLWGSVSIDQKKLIRKQWRDKYPDRYKEIILGHKKDKDSIRWLTNAEISEGTIDAVNKNQSEVVIGQLEL